MENLSTVNKQKVIPIQNGCLEIGIKRSIILPQIIHESEAIRKLLKLTVRFAGCLDSYPLLITGETGTGKSLFALLAHEMSQKVGKLVLANCAGYNGDPNMMNSDFFGHRKGAFTGASEDKTGLFELANGGVIFLDEIGELPLAVQGQLLRVLDDGTFNKLGDNVKNRHADTLVVAATNKDLEKEVKEKRFRSDLFYRLSRARIEIPPLRERPEDILPLARHFLEKCSLNGGNGNAGNMKFFQEAIDLMRKYHWPGNVRELENVISVACVLCNGVKKIINKEDLRLTFEKNESQSCMETDTENGLDETKIISEERKTIKELSAAETRSSNSIEEEFLQLEGAKEFKEKFPKIVLGKSTWAYVSMYAKIALAISDLRKADGNIKTVKGDQRSFLKKIRRIENKTGIDLEKYWNDNTLPSIPEEYKNKPVGEINQEIIGEYLKLVYRYSWVIARK